MVRNLPSIQHSQSSPTDYVTVWYFFNDIYPQTNNNSRPLDPPRFWVRLFEGSLFGNAQQEVQPPGMGRDINAGIAPEVR